jgi:hypothetical protein
MPAEVESAGLGGLFVWLAHRVMDSKFTVLEFGETVISVVYVEGLVGWLYLDRQQDPNS